MVWYSTQFIFVDASEQKKKCQSTRGPVRFLSCLVILSELIERSTRGHEPSHDC